MSFRQASGAIHKKKLFRYPPATYENRVTDFHSSKAVMNMPIKILLFFFLIAPGASDIYCQPRPFGLGSEVIGTIIKPVDRAAIDTDKPGAEVNISTRAPAGAGRTTKGRGQPAAVKRKRPPFKTVKVTEEVAREAPKTKAEIIRPLEIVEATPPENTLARILSAITINTDRGPIIPFPVVDSNKEMGLSVGIMPIIAVRSKDKKTIKAVLAPSVTYNEYLKTTITYRHYIFPDDKKLFLLRASYSEKVEKEFIVYYYTPQAWDSDIRVNGEATNVVTGKPSFYGLGINSSHKNNANYALNSTGEDFNFDLPLIDNLFLDFTHSFYLKRITDGPLEAAQVSDVFPSFFKPAAVENKFLNNRFALVYDDTDHPFLPKIGTYAAASVSYSAKRLISDFNYRTYAFELKHYYNYKEEGNYVTAIHYLLQFVRGDDLPFYALPQLGESTGLRMAGDGRFVDRGKFVFNIEERITLSRSPFMKFISESEIAPFLDVGTVFPELHDFRARNLKYGPGISARIVIRPQVVATFDFAFGSEGNNAIIKVGYPF